MSADLSAEVVRVLAERRAALDAWGRWADGDSSRPVRAITASVAERRALYDAIETIADEHQTWTDSGYCYRCTDENYLPVPHPCPSFLAAARALGLGPTGEQGNENG